MNIVNNTAVTLKTGIGEMVKSLDAIVAEREHIKDIIDSLHDKTDIPKKYIRKIAKLIQSATVTTHRAEMDELNELLSQIVDGINTSSGTSKIT